MRPTCDTPGRRTSSFAWVVPTLTAALCALSAAPSYAHHGRDFLLARTASLPHPRELYLIPRQDYVDEGEEQEIEAKPTLLLGLTSWLAAEMHAHIAKEGSEDFELESTVLAIHLRLTPPEDRWGLGLTFEYEFSHLDELPDVAEGVLIVSRETARTKLAFNVFAEEKQESDADVEWAYAAGLRGPVTRSLDLGIEVLGDLEEPGDGEALIGVYVEPAPRLTLNVGVGTGFGDEELDFSVRTSLVVRLGRDH